MGIPRLSQDLLPYTERLVFGSTSGQSSEAVDSIVTSLIIDGPSLVYHIYNKLLAYMTISTPTLTAQLPSYAEINQALAQFLSEVEDHGVEVQYLFFDGALPESKRDVRVERMERLRQQLEIYRKMYPEFPPIRSARQSIDLKRALWDTPVMSTRKLALPAPPFMVASAIESLLSPNREAKLRVVPGEADIFCAVAAKRTGAAILTNDSDLAVHDLGIDGRIILLHSLEKKHTALSVRGTITALGVHPNDIAARLQVSSLLRFGFERYMDPSLSAAMVKERAKDHSRLEGLTGEYEKFSEQYLTVESAQQPQMDGIDPRTAELVVNMAADSPHIYLTPLLEDPSRDSSWSYGTSVRQLAYSLLCSVHTQPKPVTEHARKGQRISSSTVQALTEKQLKAQLDQVVHSLDMSDTYGHVVEEPLLFWYILAFRLVHQQKLDAGKTTPAPSQFSRLLGLQPLSTPLASRPSWDDIHLLANMHAVLYSFRILHQLLRHVMSTLTEASRRDEELVHTSQQLLEKLDTLPSIADLFLDIHMLRARIGSVSLEARNAALVELDRLFQATTSGDGADTEQIYADQQYHNPSQAGEDEWQPAKRRRKGKRAPQHTADSNTQSSNMFNLLMDG